MFVATLTALSKWLAATSLSGTIQTTGWVIPTLQTIHILCVAVLFSSAVLVDLRMLGILQRDVPLPEVARRFLPAIWPILLVLLITGSLLIVGEPRRSLVNGTFYLKMALLAVAIVLTSALQWSLASTPGFWDRDMGRRIAGGFAAVASILVWTGILFAGRWIAYTQAG
jgi:branched-subunit amino acid transport protein